MNVIKGTPALRDMTDSELGKVFGIHRTAFTKKKNCSDNRRFTALDLRTIKISYPDVDWSSVEVLVNESEGDDGKDPVHIGRCFVCGKNYDRPGWLLDSSGRFCTECTPNARWNSHRSSLVSILPDWENVKLEPALLPSLDCDRQIDIFARWIGDDKPAGKFIGQHNEKVVKTYMSSLLPYKRDAMAEHGFRCGSPIVYRSKSLELLMNLRQEVYVLDLQFYLWSNTLKDPRSWAIVNFALENKVKSLALWTAGNAGLSLAKMCSFLNRFHSPSEHLWVYVLFTMDDPHAIELLPTLKLWRAEAIPLPVNSVYDPLQTREVVNQYCSSISRELGNYWETTDGWEGLGSQMYRLLMAQVVSQIDPDSILLPAGTGNFLVGTVQACEDIGQRRTIYAATPENDNIFDTIELHPGRSARNSQKVRNERPHSMRKLAGTYSPLMPCVDAALRRELLDQKTNVREIAISNDILRSAATSLLSAGIRAEPSAIAPFAALLTSEVRSSVDEFKKILIVNTGCGLLSSEEYKFLNEARP